MSKFLTLHEAAERLGVHYMTVYRYVRLGQLAARKERGTWRVAESDLELFQRRDNGSGTADAVSRRSAPWSARLGNRLLEGDATGAWKVVEGALTAGLEPLDIYCDVIVPALEHIGSAWAKGEIGIADEHLATMLVARLLGRLGPSFNRRGRRKGVVVVAGPQGERHTLSLAMAADALRAGGYSALEFGSDMPLAEFERQLRAWLPLKGVCVGVLNGEAVDAARQMVAAARRIVGPTVPVVVGGGAIPDEDHALRLGADRWADLRSISDAGEGGRHPAVAVSVLGP